MKFCSSVTAAIAAAGFLTAACTDNGGETTHPSSISVTVGSDCVGTGAITVLIDGAVAGTTAPGGAAVSKQVTPGDHVVQITASTGHPTWGAVTVNVPESTIKTVPFICTG